MNSALIPEEATRLHLCNILEMTEIIEMENR